ncbi:MAG: hypothetical protein WBA12_16225 [Catalinimonas sp.]
MCGRETWRGSPFRVGATRRVIAGLKQWPMGSPLRVGARLTYRRSTYSHYDGLSFYHFRDAKGDIKAWVLHDDEPLDLWAEYFVGDKAAAAE